MLTAALPLVPLLARRLLPLRALLRLSLAFLHQAPDRWRVGLEAVLGDGVATGSEEPGNDGARTITTAGDERRASDTDTQPEDAEALGVSGEPMDGAPKREDTREPDTPKDAEGPKDVGAPAAPKHPEPVGAPRMDARPTTVDAPSSASVRDPGPPAGGRADGRKNRDD